jgi:hypothetical protein
MKPLPSLSKTLNASRSSSSESVSCSAQHIHGRQGWAGAARRLRRSGARLHLAGHEVQELGEVDGAVAVRVNLQ